MRSARQSIHGFGTGLLFGITAFLVLGLAALPSRAATVRVPSDQPTIQAGVDVATEGDTVLVAEGTYYERGITIQGRGIVLISESGPAVTTIDCLGLGNLRKS